MSSNPSVGNDVLRTIHRIHRQLADLRERLARGPRQIRAAEANVKHREELLAKLQAEVKAMRIAADQKQLQLKGAEEKIKELNRKLNAVETNREYQVLRDQIAADKMTNSVLTDEILEALEKIDAFDPQIHEAQQALQMARQKTESVHKEVQQQEPRIRADVDRLEAELKQQEVALPGPILDYYHRVVRQRGVDALAVIENECCGGCNQQVPLNVYAEILMSHPMFCKTCGRLLYLAEDRAPKKEDD